MRACLKFNLFLLIFQCFFFYTAINVYSIQFRCKMEPINTKLPQSTEAITDLSMTGGML